MLDPATAGLTLMLKGAPLQRFTVLGLQVGHPRVAWASARDPRHVQSVIWSSGELDPPRQIDRLVHPGGANPGRRRPNRRRRPSRRRPRRCIPCRRATTSGSPTGSRWRSCRGKRTRRSAGGPARGPRWPSGARDIISAMRRAEPRCHPAAHHAGSERRAVVLSLAAAGGPPHRARRRGRAASGRRAARGPGGERRAATDAGGIGVEGLMRAGPRVSRVSILNDVLGPVMRGPSSSHTAGSYHIAKLVTGLLGAARRRPPSSRSTRPARTRRSTGSRAWTARSRRR